MLWSKQYYHYDVDAGSTSTAPIPFGRAQAAPRNADWYHMVNADVISMPDKWEYPWYAAWDLAFHVIALTLVDADFAQAAARADAARALPASQRADPGLRVELRRRQPAGARLGDDLHLPPRTGSRRAGDVDWLERVFQKLLLNFTWWVNRKDRTGSNVFEGGFLGPRQHRRLRPQLAAADRRLPRAGRRHGLDGAVQPEHAGDRHRAGDARAGVRGHGRSSSSSTSCGSPRR